MEIKIKTGEYEVIASGSIVGNHNEPIEFELSTLFFIFEFITDTNSPESKINKTGIDDKTLKIELINFNNTLGTRNTAPLPIGTVNNRKLFVNFSSYSLSESTGPIFHYSFLHKIED
ncbi:MAG: DUF6864 domain-containing function [Kordia sp.]|uniref:DUF6864 domain-containing function n=1 Tax=Kordia sp. TaxID=1965332 RepID=UPI0038591607